MMSLRLTIAIYSENVMITKNFNTLQNRSGDINKCIFITSKRGPLNHHQSDNY